VVSNRTVIIFDKCSLAERSSKKTAADKLRGGTYRKRHKTL